MPTPEIKAMVEQRRKALQDSTGALQDGHQPSAENDGLWGLALSGGGIRSATFCFGLLKALAHDGSLLRFDLLSTVSGGGYIGSTVGKLFHQASNPRQVRDTAEAIGQADTRWVAWWLRANGRYLIPGGLLDKVFAATLFLRNLVAVHLELGLVGLLLGAALALMNALVWARLAPSWEAAASGRTNWLTAWLSWVLERGSLLAWLPTVWLALLPLGLGAAVLACSYWALRDPPPGKARPSWWKTHLLWTLMALLLWWFRPLQPTPLASEPIPLRWPEDLRWAWLVAFGGTLAWLLASVLTQGLWNWYLARQEQEQDGTTPAQQQFLLRALLRNYLTRWLSWLGLAALAVLVLGLVDRLAWYLAFEGRQAWWAMALATLAALLRLLLPRLVAGSATQRPMVGLSLAGVGHAAGLLLLLMLAVWWVSVADSLVFVSSEQGAAWTATPWLRASFLLLAVSGYAAFTRHNIAFLNRSSLHDFYRARLVRSYLGAANGRRFEPPEQPPGPDVTLKPIRPVPDEPPGGLRVNPVHEVNPWDDLPMESYAPHRHGGPVHLLNVCINQTRSPRGGLFNQDRRGLPLTLGPEGQARVGLRPWQKLAGDQAALTLGTWMSVSGAAVAPGLGSATAPGMAVLTTCAGLRLGYWWDSSPIVQHKKKKHAKPRIKTLMLLDELVGRFDAEARSHWYLSDGGHYENTGAYALLAEEAELIVLADCGADPRYGFEDLENLVRKARIDLQASIEFLRPNPEANPPVPRCFGTLDDLASADSKACIAVARIHYHHSGRRGVLVLVKPNVCSGLPVDLINFKREYPAFPQESTTDQFFSEPQWESYFKLGQALGALLGGDVLRQLPRHIEEYRFVSDDDALVGSRARQTQAPAQAPASGRLPQRIAGPTIAATVSLGAATTIGIPLWQALESLRGERAAAQQLERQSLKEITDLYGKLDRQDNNTALAALAASLLRVADTQCASDTAGWFQRSAMAQCVLQHTRTLCEQTRNVPACDALVRSSDEQPTLCLDAQALGARGDRKPHYWGHDFAPALPSCNAPLGQEAGLFNNKPPDTVLPPAPPPTAPPPPPVPAPGPVAPLPVPAPASSPTAERTACKGRTIYIQIPGPERRADAQRLRQQWQGWGATVPAIEDVNASAARAGRSAPRPYPVTTVLFHDAASKDCAELLFPRPAPDTRAGARQVKPLPAGLKPTPGVIEVWMAPDKP